MAAIVVVVTVTSLRGLYGGNAPNDNLVSLAMTITMLLLLS